MVAPDRVSLEWSFVDHCAPVAGELTSHTFRVERQVDGSDRWELIASELPPDTRAFVDRTTKDGSAYRYRVTARNPDTGRSLAAEIPVQVPSIWRLTFANAIRGMALVTITKYEATRGSYLTLRHVHRTGDRIGWWDDPPTSLHLAALPGKDAAMADFNTGITLVSVEPVVRAVALKRCKLFFALDGTLLGCRQDQTTINVPVSSVRLRDERGAERVVDVPDPLENPRFQDQVCTHPQYPHTLPPGPPTREQVVRGLLAEADGLWGTDSKAAIDTYKTLLAEYRDVLETLRASVRVQRRAEQDD